MACHDFGFPCPGNGDVALEFGSAPYVGLGLIVYCLLIIIELFGSPFMRNTSVGPWVQGSFRFGESLLRTEGASFLLFFVLVFFFFSSAYFSFSSSCSSILYSIPDFVVI